MHKRRGRRRRMGKTAVLLGLLAALALMTSWRLWTPPEPEPVKGLCEQELVVARTLYELSGDNGFAHEYLVNSTPEQAAYIRGEATP